MIKTNTEMYEKLAAVKKEYEETKDRTLGMALDIIERMQKIIKLGDKTASFLYVHGFRWENDEEWQELHPDYYAEYLTRNSKP